MPTPGFAVIDFETTGLFAGGHDRVVEVAVVHVDPNGEIEGRWDTLVNPGRDLGPQHVHRIRAADVLDAPTFAQITPRQRGDGADRESVTAAADCGGAVAIGAAH